jgi:G:T/U-mismatch repair DNA glycosylase
MTSASRIETHPYGPFIPKGVKAIILGTFPAWEFSQGDASLIHPEKMIDFNYGRIRGANANFLWRLLGEIHKTPLESPSAIKKFLRDQKLGLADVYARIRRKKPRSSSDNDLVVVEYNDELISILQKNHTIQFVFCTSQNVQRIFQRHFAPRINRVDLKVIALTSPSASANRAIGSHEEYRKKFAHLKGDRTFAYRLAQYRKHFPLK